MTGMGGFGFALEFRDIIKGMVEAKVNEVRPAYRYGVVQSFDRVTRKCVVLLVGDTVAVTVNLMDQQPVTNGQVVQVDGIGQDKFISGIKGYAFSPYQLQYAGSFAVNTTMVASNYYYANAGSNITFTLPASAKAGDSVWIKRADASAFTVTIAVQVGDKLDGVLNGTKTIDAQYDGMILTADGTGNWVVARFGYGVASATANALIRRDANARAQVASPGTGAGGASDIANRAFVDGKLKKPFNDNDPADLKWHWVNMYGEPIMQTGSFYDTAYVQYAPARFRKDEEGCVWLEGLLTGVTSGVSAWVFTLPPGYRPAYTLVFTSMGVAGAAVQPSQITIDTAGKVYLTAGGTGFFSLDNVSFIAEDFNPPTWTTPVLANSWVKGGTAANCAPRYYLDSAGDLHLSGQMKSGTVSTNVFVLPNGFYSTDYDQSYIVASGTGTARIDILHTGAVQVISYNTGGSNALVSLDGIVLSNVNGSWATIAAAFSNSWVAYGSTYAPPQYCINKHGYSAIRGMVKLGTTAIPTTIFATGKINKEAWPNFQKTFVVGMNAGAARLDVLQDGTVQYAGSYGSPTNAYLSLQSRWLAGYPGRR